MRVRQKKEVWIYSTNIGTAKLKVQSCKVMDSCDNPPKRLQSEVVRFMGIRRRFRASSLKPASYVIW